MLADQLRVPRSRVALAVAFARAQRANFSDVDASWLTPGAVPTTEPGDAGIANWLGRLLGG